MSAPASASTASVRDATPAPPQQPYATRRTGQVPSKAARAQALAAPVPRGRPSAVPQPGPSPCIGLPGDRASEEVDLRRLATLITRTQQSPLAKQVAPLKAAPLSVAQNRRVAAATRTALIMLADLHEAGDDSVFTLHDVATALCVIEAQFRNAEEWQQGTYDPEYDPEYDPDSPFYGMRPGEVQTLMAIDRSVKETEALASRGGHARGSRRSFGTTGDA